MSERDKFPSEIAERFQVRLPPGLRDRIKAYAEAHGRSMNTEIVRVLENEFPAPLSMDDRLSELEEVVGVLRAGVDDPGVDKFVAKIEETIRDIISGRLEDVRDKSRVLIERASNDLEVDKSKYDPSAPDLDEEERLQLERTGTTAKIVHRKGKS